MARGVRSGAAYAPQPPSFGRRRSRSPGKITKRIGSFWLVSHPSRDIIPGDWVKQLGAGRIRQWPRMKMRASRPEQACSANSGAPCCSSSPGMRPAQNITRWMHTHLAPATMVRNPRTGSHSRPKRTGCGGRASAESEDAASSTGIHKLLRFPVAPISSGARTRRHECLG